MTEPFMPTVEMTPDTEIKTTWGVLQGYMKEIAELKADVRRLQRENSQLRDSPTGPTAR